MFSQVGSFAWKFVGRAVTVSEGARADRADSFVDPHLWPLARTTTEGDVMVAPTRIGTVFVLLAGFCCLCATIRCRGVSIRSSFRRVFSHSVRATGVFLCSPTIRCARLKAIMRRGVSATWFGHHV